MSYVQITASFEIIQKFIKSYSYPITLFNKTVQFINEVIIHKEPNDKNEYIVTLYTEKFKINLDRKTLIHNLLGTKEYIDIYEDVTSINLYETNFYKRTER